MLRAGDENRKQQSQDDSSRKQQDSGSERDQAGDRSNTGNQR